MCSKNLFDFSWSSVGYYYEYFGLGSKEYGELVREPLIGLVEILKIFESCQPPVERILGKKEN